MSDSEEQRTPRGGPRTAVGKAVAALNATRHGLRANTPVIPGVEDPEEWNEHRAGIVESLRPVGLLETVLAERVALILWRMHRVARYEAAVLAARQEDGQADGAQARWRAAVTVYQPAWVHEFDSRPQPPSPATLIDLIQRLPGLPRRLEISAPTALALLRAVAECAGVARWETLKLPGVGHEQHLYYVTSMSAQNLRGAVKVIAEAGGCDPETILDTVSAEVSALPVPMEAAEPPQPSRLLPEADCLDKVTRYESHLNKQMLSALHELQALQAQRAGREAPLARLDITGLPDHIELSKEPDPRRLS